jgi:hypothetical protein
MRVREAFGHHLIPLLLLSSIDGESLPAERQAILRYLLDRAEATGMNLCADEKIALRVYVCEFKRRTRTDVSAKEAASRKQNQPEGVDRRSPSSGRRRR